MDRNNFIQKCQKASFKQDVSGSWWSVQWKKEELVSYRDDLYVPIDYRFGFQRGNPTHVAILHSTRTNSVLQVPLADVKDVEP